MSGGRSTTHRSGSAAYQNNEPKRIGCPAAGANVIDIVDQIKTGCRGLSRYFARHGVATVFDRR
jgi:hypothetical protein